MTLNDSRLPTRKVIRWQGFDYGDNAVYLVTVCTARRDPFLAVSMPRTGLVLTPAGRIVNDLWNNDLPRRFPTVTLHALAVLPDHVHAIVQINDTDGRGRGMLGRLVGAMKSIAAVQINRERVTPGAEVWQARFHDRVLRDEEEFAHACWYVEDNPQRWVERYGGV